METANDRTEEILQEELERATVSSTSSDQQQDDDGPEEGQPPKASKNKPTTTDKDPKKKNKYKAVFNITEARYPVVRYVGKKLMGYKLTKDENADWDLFWVDNAVLPETLAKMKPYQKINHFPGMYSLARKNHLGRNLMRMKKAFPKNFKFFPQTFLLPAEYSEFRQQTISKKGHTFIVKPEASCQGKGIFLTKNCDNIEPGEHYVVQRYLTKPFLMDGLKFDLRIYVLLAGCDPLRIYLYDDGLGRFATEEYVAPTANNMDNMCIHLTNYAINKDNPNFVFNEDSAKDDVGHKRSLKAVLRQLEDAGHDVKTLWNDIKKIIIKTFCSVQPILAHSYKSCQPDEPYNNMCFEVLGFDIILDHKLKPWLLEVNHTPSFTTDTPLDKTIKRNVIKDALALMNISSNHRIKYKNKKKIEMQERVLTGKKTKPTLEEKQAAHVKAQKERDAWESKHLGGYEKIYPIDDPAQIEEDYEGFIANAHSWWETWTGTSAAKKNAKKAETPAKPNAGPPTTATGAAGSSFKMKEVRSASEKLRLDTLSRKISSSKKIERNEGLSEAERKQDDSITDVLVDQETQPKTEITPSNKSNEGEQQVAAELDDLNFVTRSKAERADTKEDRRESSIEKLPKAELAAPEGPISVIDFAQHRISQSENTLRPEENSQRDTHHDQYKSPIPFRKPYSSLTTKESSMKQIGSPVDQDNSKASLRERPQTFTNQQKFPPIYLKPHATTINKLPDNVEDEGSLSRRNLVNRLPYQKATTTRIPDESTNTEEQIGSGFERKPRNLTYVENGKATMMNKNGYLKGSNKRMEIQPHQAKMPVGNFVVPRMFELSVKSANAIQPVRQTVVHAGFNAFSKGVVKGSQLHREVNNRSSASNYPPESHINSTKGHPFYVQSRK